MKNLLPLLIVGLFSCQTPNREASIEKPPIKEEVKAIDVIVSFLGEELKDKELPNSTRKKFEENFQVAQERVIQYPDSLELIIWQGRRLAYLGQFLESIQVYTDGLVKYPLSHRLRRHRGHRYITTRQISNAVDDFEMAAFHAANATNGIEPDGLPNKLNQPLGNDFFNIWYHFGLAHYLDGRYDKAISAYNQCMKVSDNNDLMVATTYWLYMSYKKVGNVEMAEELLEIIHSKMKMVENKAYLDLLLLFKGEKKAETLLAKAKLENGTLNPTLAYGVGNWYQQQGNTSKANEIFLQIMESPSWDSFGFIAAEKELTSAFPVP
ncbi:MAG: hypothetical protein AB8B73_14900 [Ekhidna sp.]